MNESPSEQNGRNTKSRKMNTSQRNAINSDSDSDSFCQPLLDLNNQSSNYYTISDTEQEFLRNKINSIGNQDQFSSSISQNTEENVKTPSIDSVKEISEICLAFTPSIAESIEYHQTNYDSSLIDKKRKSEASNNDLVNEEEGSKKKTK